MTVLDTESSSLRRKRGSQYSNEPSALQPDLARDRRQLPHDLDAEQAVLGAMLLSKDAIADVLVQVRPAQFYQPEHQSVCEVIVDVYGRGEPADAVTVAAELDRRGLLLRIGGAPYLHTLIATVPTAANAGYYAGIVAEKALMRRLIEAGTRVVAYGYSADGGHVAEMVDRAQAEVYDITNHSTTGGDAVVLEHLLQPVLDEIDSICPDGGCVGIPTGFIDLDAVTTGLHGIGKGRYQNRRNAPQRRGPLVLGVEAPIPSHVWAGRFWVVAIINAAVDHVIRGEGVHAKAVA